MQDLSNVKVGDELACHRVSYPNYFRVKVVRVTSTRIETESGAEYDIKTGLDVLAKHVSSYCIVEPITPETAGLIARSEHRMAVEEQLDILQDLINQLRKACQNVNAQALAEIGVLMTEELEHATNSLLFQR